MKKGHRRNTIRVKTADKKTRNRKQPILNCACVYILGEALSAQRETYNKPSVESHAWELHLKPLGTEFLFTPIITCWKSYLKKTSSPWRLKCCVINQSFIASVKS